MRIVVGSDHAGVVLKISIREHLCKLDGITVVDVGADSETPAADYPDITVEACRALQQGQVDRGILVCGSGIGMCIAANKCRGIRACVCHDVYSAAQGVEHDGMNVLALGARVIGPALARSVVEVFVNARFSNEQRHRRRLEKVTRLEDVG
ncbi:MAG: ribose 5-phosphate isomerase B [Myxococcota bacterium]